MSTSPLLRLVSRAAGSGGARHTCRASFGEPAQCCGYASRTRSCETAHETNLNGPVPTGCLAAVANVEGATIRTSPRPSSSVEYGAEVVIFTVEASTASTALIGATCARSGALLAGSSQRSMFALTTP